MHPTFGIRIRVANAHAFIGVKVSSFDGWKKKRSDDHFPRLPEGSAGSGWWSFWSLVRRA